MNQEGAAFSRAERMVHLLYGAAEKPGPPRPLILFKPETYHCFSGAGGAGGFANFVSSIGTFNRICSI